MIALLSVWVHAGERIIVTHCNRNNRETRQTLFHPFLLPLLSLPPHPFAPLILLHFHHHPFPRRLGFLLLVNSVCLAVCSARVVWFSNQRLIISFCDSRDDTNNVFSFFLERLLLFWFVSDYLSHRFSVFSLSLSSRLIIDIHGSHCWQYIHFLSISRQPQWHRATVSQHEGRRSSRRRVRTKNQMKRHQKLSQGVQREYVRSFGLRCWSKREIW